eukprot:4196646-Prymnesium_polylepis.1
MSARTFPTGPEAILPSSVEEVLVQRKATAALAVLQESLTAAHEEQQLSLIHISEPTRRS